jgi:hypothetical protein
MEIEIVGICKGFDKNNNLIILNDKNEEIILDNSFFVLKPLTNINKYLDKHISFYFKDKYDYIYSIVLIDETEKQTCLCFNNIQGNYFMTLRRLKIH